MKDLKEYREQPDEGLFGKIQRRLAWRRAMRIGGAVLAGLTIAATVIVVVGVLVMQDRHSIDQPQFAATQPVVDQYTTTVGAVSADIAPTINQTQSTAPVAKTAAVIHADTSTETAIPSTSQQVNELASQQVGESASQQVSELASQRENESTSQQVSESTSQQVNETTTEQHRAQPKNSDNGQTPQMSRIILAPTIIAPNGEVEENRMFLIKTTAEITDFQMQIFNRRGQRVYSTTDVSFRWDAGSMPQGGYVWIATFRDSNGRPRQERGSVVVVR